MPGERKRGRVYIKELAADRSDGSCFLEERSCLEAHNTLNNNAVELLRLPCNATSITEFGNRAYYVQQFLCKERLDVFILLRVAEYE